jgi:hypothetical protein
MSETVIRELLEDLNSNPNENKVAAFTQALGLWARSHPEFTQSNENAELLSGRLQELLSDQSFQPVSLHSALDVAFRSLCTDGSLRREWLRLEHRKKKK